MRLAEVFVCTPTDFLGMKLGTGFLGKLIGLLIRLLIGNDFGNFGNEIGKTKKYFTKVCPTAQNTLLKYGKIFGEFFNTKKGCVKKRPFP